jgi:hypothetical protein
MSQICGMLKNPVITWKLGHRQNSSAISRPIIPPYATRNARVDGDVGHLAAKVRTSKGRGKQWQPTPKNLPRTRVQGPYRSPDWALVPAKPAQRLNTNTNNIPEYRNRLPHFWWVTTLSALLYNSAHTHYCSSCIQHTSCLFLRKQTLFTLSSQQKHWLYFFMVVQKHRHFILITRQILWFGRFYWKVNSKLYLTLWILKGKQWDNTLLSCVPRIRKSNYLFEGSQASPLDLLIKVVNTRQTSREYQ